VEKRPLKLYIIGNYLLQLCRVYWSDCIYFILKFIHRLNHHSRREVHTAIFRLLMARFWHFSPRRSDTTTMVPMGWNIWRQISPHWCNGVKFGAKYFTPLVPWWCVGPKKWKFYAISEYKRPAWAFTFLNISNVLNISRWNRLRLIHHLVRRSSTLACQL